MSLNIRGTSNAFALIQQSLFSSIHNKDLSTPTHMRVCSNPCYVYYYDDETISFQAFLCKFEFSLFSMKFHEKNLNFKNDVPCHLRKNLGINSAAPAGLTPQSFPHPQGCYKNIL